MSVTVQDKGKYLRGLLLLIKKDQRVVVNEKEWIFELSKVLGFDKEFIEGAIDDLPENDFLESAPPKFSTPDVAKAFIIDGLHLAYADHHFNPSELLWVNSVAQTNNVDILLGYDELQKIKKDVLTKQDLFQFEIEKLLPNS